LYYGIRGAFIRAIRFASDASYSAAITHIRGTVPDFLSRQSQLGVGVT
jgi:hypothetical protein